MILTPQFISYLGRNSRSQLRARYECDCGAIFEALEYNVKSGHTKSCGCAKPRILRAARLTHNESRPQSAEYRAWAGMKKRCLDVSSKSFPRYGGRGIRIFPEWILSYEAFLAHVGRRPSPMHSLDRFPNNNGNYAPGNVRWATSKEQARNRRSNRIIEFQGRSQCLRAWADELGISQATLSRRIKKGPFHIAMTALTLEDR